MDRYEPITLAVKAAIKKHVDAWLDETNQSAKAYITGDKVFVDRSTYRSLMAKQPKDFLGRPTFHGLTVFESYALPPVQSWPGASRLRAGL